jgi:RNA polymerase subunit RPABC4/transcription elongation factor Spt4
MSRFSEGLRIIPRTALFIAIVCYLTMTTVVMTVLIPEDNEMKYWPLAGKIAFTYGTFLIIVAWILLIGYVYADAKRRGMRYVLWTWLAALIPNGIGIILYFILRDSLPRPCPGCSTPVKSGFVFCPYCGTAMKPTCPNCGRAVEHGWSNCPECGSKLPALTTTPRVA